MKVPAKPTQSLFNAFSAFAVRCGSTSWEKTNRLLAQLDFKFISWFQVQHGCVSLADQQVAVALNFCGVAQFATTLANCSSAAGEIYPFSVEKGLVGRSEVKALAAILLCRYISASPYQISL